MGKVWDRTDLQTGEKMVLLALADWSNDEGHCWPSVSRLAQRCALGDRQVRRIIKKFEADGVLSVRNRGRRSNYYILNLDIKPDTDVQLSLPENDLTGHLEHVKPDMGVRSINEPSVEPKTPAAKKTPPASQHKKSSPHHWFISWWCFAYQQVVDQKYAITKKDAGQVANLIKRLDLEELTARACAYLALPAEKRFPRGSPTLGGLLCQINEVASGFDAALEQRFTVAGLLPDFDQFDQLTDFQPWRKHA